MSARSKFIEHAGQQRIAATAWDAMIMASTHDPDHARLLRDLDRQIRKLTGRIEKFEAIRKT